MTKTQEKVIENMIGKQIRYITGSGRSKTSYIRSAKVGHRANHEDFPTIVYTVSDSKNETNFMEHFVVHSQFIVEIN